MCIIIGENQASVSVGSTKIFARHTVPRRQLIVYQMNVESRSNAAMILPVPVNVQTESCVAFIDMSDRPDFFVELEGTFPKEMRRSSTLSFGTSRGIGMVETLKVHNVGSFEASVVPTHDDWDRLDPRFRLPKSQWDKLLKYSYGYSFVVFQLKIKSNAVSTIHPMAFEFFTRMPEFIFFPTVHCHDGYVSYTDRFDHSLYYQHSSPGQVIFAVNSMWHNFDQKSTKAPMASTSMKPHVTINSSQETYKFDIKGDYRNEDVLIRL